MTRHLSQCRPTPEPSPAWLESGWLFPEVEPFPLVDWLRAAPHRQANLRMLAEPLSRLRRRCLLYDLETPTRGGSIYE